MFQKLVDLWVSLAPVEAALPKESVRELNRENELFTKYVLPEQQQKRFMAPQLGPETRQWLHNRDPGVVKIDDAIRYVTDVINQVMIGVFRWFGILQAKAQAVKSGNGDATVSVDAVELLDYLSQIAEANARIVLSKLIKKLPNQPKRSKPGDLYVTQDGVPGGAAMESSCRSAKFVRKCVFFFS